MRLAVLIGLTLHGVYGSAASEQVVARPNIIVFLVDDLGWQDTSLQLTSSRTRFNDHFRTPHLEALASRGVKFTNAYACAVCSPSRTSIMTGLNAARHSVTNWTLYADKETSGRTRRLRAPLDWKKRGLQPGQPTLANALQQLGYQTIHAGKAHWGAYETPGSDPKKLGFDVNIAGHAAGGPGGYAGQNNFGNRQPRSHTKPWGVPGLEAYHGTETHLTDALAAEAKRAIQEAVDDSNPFFLYFAPYAVHAPIQPHPRFVENYRGKKYPGTSIEIPEVEANYASMVEGVDDALGQLLRELQRLKVANQTIILFTSDNGALSLHARGTTPYGSGRDTHVAPLREGKGSAYEGGTRVPMVVGWASVDPSSLLQTKVRIEQDATQQVPVIIEDVMPTVLNWAGGALTGDVDGQDITPLLLPSRKERKDAANERFERALVFHYPHQWTGAAQGGYQPHSSIRLGRWKAIYFYETQRWELYDLELDESESKNLAGASPDLLERLAHELREKLVERNAKWPVSLRTGNAVKLRLPSEITFPGMEWELVSPMKAGWTTESLGAVAEYLGGRGMICFDGKRLHSWGDPNRSADVASACKPLYVHFLIRAVQDGRLPSLDERVGSHYPAISLLNERSSFKDRAMTFRHLATQTSCYGVGEKPGSAFDYNDFQTAPFFDTLFVRVLNTARSDIDQRWLRPFLMSELGCQDYPSFFAFGDADRPGRLRISPRDFCRFGLLYSRGGTWNQKPIVSPAFVRLVTGSPLPAQFPRTKAVVAEMVPEQRSIGSTTIPDDQTDHLGCYSWMWWVNGKRTSGKRLWPDAPYAYACLGHKHGRRGMAIVPEWDLVLSWNDSKLDQREWKDPSRDPHPLNEVFRLLRAGDTHRAAQDE